MIVFPGFLFPKKMPIRGKSGGRIAYKLIRNLN